MRTSIEMRRSQSPSKRTSKIKSTINLGPKYEFSVFDPQTHSSQKYSSKQVDLLNLLTSNIIKDLRELKTDKLNRVQNMKNPSPSVEASLICLHVLFDHKEDVKWSDLANKNAEEFYIKLLRFQDLELDINHIRKAKHNYYHVLQREEKVQNDINFAAHHHEYIFCKQSDLKSKSIYQILIDLAGQFVSLFEILYFLNREPTSAQIETPKQQPQKPKQKAEKAPKAAGVKHSKRDKKLQSLNQTAASQRLATEYTEQSEGRSLVMDDEMIPRDQADCPDQQPQARLEYPPREFQIMEHHEEEERLPLTIETDNNIVDTTVTRDHSNVTPKSRSKRYHLHHGTQSKSPIRSEIKSKYLEARTPTKLDPRAKINQLKEDISSIDLQIQLTSRRLDELSHKYWEYEREEKQYFQAIEEREMFDSFIRYEQWHNMLEETKIDKVLEDRELQIMKRQFYEREPKKSQQRTPTEQHNPPEQAKRFKPKNTKQHKLVTEQLRFIKSDVHYNTLRKMVDKLYQFNY